MFDAVVSFARIALVTSGVMLALVLCLFTFYAAGRAFGLGFMNSLRVLRAKHLTRRQ